MRSQNEVCGMVIKAARGAGVPLGHCEDLALAAGYLAATDPVRLACLTEALTGPHAVVLADWSPQVVQITDARAVMAGPVAVDALRAGASTVELQNIDAPRLVIALCAAQNMCVDHRFEGADLIIKLGDGPAPVPPTASAITVSGQLWTYLSDLAARTYVPASDASRLAGAGAGLTDND